MIYTVTFNPSLDYIIKIEKFEAGLVNRSDSENIYPGGKGINVSIVLKNLGISSKVLGYIAGFTGEEIKKNIETLGCSTDFIKLENGLSRINVKIKSDLESEINGGGPEISKDELNEMYKKILKLQEDDILVLAGSIPRTLPNDVYEKVMKILKDKKVKVIVDTTGKSLLKVLKYKPFLIKPNHHELGDLFNKKLNNNDEIIEYGKRLQEKGARNIIISMAGNGAILIKENGEAIYRNVPKGEVINSVGAGDSMIAGFIAEYIKNGNLEEAFKMGIATGSATAFSKTLAKKDMVEELLKQL